MKILSDEAIIEKLDNDWDGLDSFSLVRFVQEDTLRQVRELLDGIEKSCNCGSPSCPANTWEKAIQAVKALLEE